MKKCIVGNEDVWEVSELFVKFNPETHWWGMFDFLLFNKEQDQKKS